MQLSLYLALAQQGDDAMTGFAALIVNLVILVLTIVILVGYWKMFTKAGKPGWAIIVPIYNVIVLLQIVGRPLWWIILLLIPFVNFIVAIIVLNDLSKSFGKGIAYTLGLLFLSPIFIPLLGFGDARYIGPAAAS